MTREKTTIEEQVEAILSESPARIGAKLSQYRAVWDLREAIGALDKRLAAREAELESTLTRHAHDQGLESLTGGGVSVSFDPTAMRATYDPQKWRDICRWAGETGNDFIIQRRLTDAKVMSLVDAGIALPDGLGVESYTKVSARRK